MLPEPPRDSKRVRWIEITASKDQRNIVIAGRAHSSANVRRGACAIEARKFADYARTGTLAVRSSLPQLTQAPLMARRIAFQIQ